MEASSREAPNYQLRDRVIWRWMGGTVYGTVEEIFFEPVTKVIKGKSIKRNGSKEKPAFLVKSEAGNYALKLATELEKAPQHKVLIKI